MTIPFSKPVKRAALKRSGGRCEAVGPMYGYAAGYGCKANLAYGVEFDHIVLHANSKDNSLENCAAVCVRCHNWKTVKHDIPVAAKTVRQQDRNDGIPRRSGPPMDGSKASRFKKRMDGTVEIRR